MKRISLLIMTLIVTGTAMNASAANPLLVKKYHTPHETFPFDKVKLEHFMPAFDKAFKQEDTEIKAITSNREAPSFGNTIEALEYSGAMLHDVSSVFYTLTGSENTDELMALSSKVSVMQTEHANKITMNEALFKRIKTVYDQREKLNLTTEQLKLLENQYESFVRSGASLEGADREAFTRISIRLSELSDQFYQHSLIATNQYEKLITDSTLLKGLPDDMMTAARAKAAEKKEVGWLFDLSAPVYVSLMKNLENRSLREVFYRAYMSRAMTGELDNRPVIKEIVNLRMQMAQLLGYHTYAEYALKRRMAKTPETVISFLDQLNEAYLPVAKAELAALQGYATGYENRYFALEPWDLSYYGEKYKQARYKVSDEALRPYFKLENVIDGVFGLATKLYGITFKKNDHISIWNKEVDAWEVFDQDGSFLAVLYTDFHPRKGKRAGAWMSDFNEQYRKNGVDIRPHISITMNFTRSTETKPSLLTYSEVETFMHEFGHSLHGMFSNVTYRSLAGTSVFRDFVELPSQLMENWASRKEFLDSFAKHYKTGEPIPAELIQKIKEAQNFNVAMACVRQLSFGYLDMAYHSIEKPLEGDVVAFEREAWAKTILVPQPDDCFMSAAFTHLFSGGYAAGYYGYKWAEVLDADAFEWFVHKQTFDRDVANSFRTAILSKGGTEDPMVLYQRFRGQEPSIDALLRRNEIIK